ncbi:MAG: EamA family transporter, partial [Rubrivivax sp.]
LDGGPGAPVDAEPAALVDGGRIPAAAGLARVAPHVAADPALAAFFNNLTPLFAAVFSAALLGESPSAYHAVAFALIVGGIAVSMRRSV